MAPWVYYSGGLGESIGAFFSLVTFRGEDMTKHHFPGTQEHYFFFHWRFVLSVSWRKKKNWLSNISSFEFTILSLKFGVWVLFLERFLSFGSPPGPLAPTSPDSHPYTATEGLPGARTLQSRPPPGCCVRRPVCHPTQVPTISITPKILPLSHCPPVPLYSF